MKIAIDASNIRDGGGVTHLLELLKVSNPSEYHFDEVVVWSNEKTLAQLPRAPWLSCRHQPLLDKSLLHRIFWQMVVFPQLLTKEYQLLFVPGGSYRGRFRPFITMCRNMQPFSMVEIFRYWFNLKFWRLLLLRQVQKFTFRRASGLIFLSKYAKQEVSKAIGKEHLSSCIIPHGVSDIFRRPRQDSDKLKEDFTLLYVSRIDAYKHQWHVIDAVAQLRKQGYRLQLQIIGPAYPKMLQKLKHAMNKHDPKHEFVQYLGAIAYEDLPTYYSAADAFIFASSCENFPNILLESMSAGLPIACSNMGPMPEILGDAGVYFHPEHPSEIASAVKTLVDNEDLRKQLAEKAQQYSLRYSWEKCARETFSYLTSVVEKRHLESNLSEAVREQ